MLSERINLNNNFFFFLGYSIVGYAGMLHEDKQPYCHWVDSRRPFLSSEVSKLNTMQKHNFIQRN